MTTKKSKSEVLDWSDSKAVEAHLKTMPGNTGMSGGKRDSRWAKAGAKRASSKQLDNMADENGDVGAI